jgi:hypothetical protein
MSGRHFRWVLRPLIVFCEQSETKNRKGVLFLQGKQPHRPRKKIPEKGFLCGKIFKKDYN